jgi:uncharacterized protein
MNTSNPTLSFGLSEKTLSSLRSYFISIPEVDQVILYGSRARGDFHKGSDIDFMLIGSGITPRLLSKMDMEIDDLLLPYFIQITDRKEILDARFLEVVEKEGVVFWERGADISKCLLSSKQFSASEFLLSKDLGNSKNTFYLCTSCNTLFET